MAKVIYCIRPIGNWVESAERAAAADAELYFDTQGFEEQFADHWKNGLAGLSSNLFAVFCRNPEIAAQISRTIAGPESEPRAEIRYALPAASLLLLDDSTFNKASIVPEVRSIKDVETLISSQANRTKTDPIIIRGYESGGGCGEDSQYILVQKAIQKLAGHELIISGPIGIKSFAALHQLGVRSVLLDEQTFLLTDTYLPANCTSILKRINGRQSIVVSAQEDPSHQIRCICLPGKDSPGYHFGSEVSRTEISAIQRWESPGCLPVGEGIDLGKDNASRYRTLGRLIRAYQNCGTATPPGLETLRTIAEEFGVDYPIIQGPMSRVSDNPEFAQSVAREGGLPTIAAAMLTAKSLKPILEKTSELLPDRPWGVGLLGFIDSQHLQSQIDVLKASAASFCVLAGGTPAQAKEIADSGMRVFIHAPTPELLSLFISQGWRDFILEGRECGGHIGPLSSLSLWERSVEVVAGLSSAVSKDICLVFAGGIHDSTSAAFVGYLTQPLARAGTTVGLLIGSAYLATQEIVQDGAITQSYQDVSLDCTTTVFLETSPGHQSRCADTEFSREFNAKRAELLKSGMPVRDVSAELEQLILGRLRLASKGLKRTEEGLVKVSDGDQLTLGMYMLGEAVCLIENKNSIESLHKDVLQGFTLPARQSALQANTAAKSVSSYYRGQQDIAIVGMACKLPGASSPEQLWDLISNGRNQIKEVPASRWSTEDYYSPDRSVKNKIHSKWGAFIDSVGINPFAFGIPPQSLASIDPAQLLVLVCVKEALSDAGYSAETEFERESTCVILGYSGGLGELGQSYVMQAELSPLLDRFPEMAALVPEWTSDSFAGILPNVSAGRVANRFNLGGSNCTVDAACASSLAALDVAVQKLRKGEVSMAVVGAVDTLQSPFAYFCFSETQALSGTGKASSFGRNADGIVLGEGTGILVLKRLDDAIAAGDSIHAVIKGIGSSSDGRGRTMTAPSQPGQVQAFARAYDDAQTDADYLGFYEAHGTGTPVGDRSEIRALTTFLERSGAKQGICAVGSVKTLIGHTKSTAGLAGLLKATLALKHKSLPLHSVVDNHIEDVTDSAHVYLPRGNQPWITDADAPPRTAGVSAFGFGGTNYHVVLQEYKSESASRSEVSHGLSRLSHGHSLHLLTAGSGSLLQLLKSTRSSCEQTRNNLVRDGVESYLNRSLLQSLPETEISSFRFNEQNGWLLLLVDHAKDDLVETLQIAMDVVAGNSAYTKAIQRWMVYRDSGAGNTTKVPNGNGVCLLFPGQGSDYPGMGRTLLGASSLCHSLLAKLLPDKRERAKVLDSYLFNSQKSADNTIGPSLKQPLLAITEIGYLDLLNKLEIPWTTCLGHSLGDFISAHANGLLTAECVVDVLSKRGGLVQKFQVEGYGMLILFCARQQAEQLISGLNETGLEVANINAPAQTVVSGPTPALAELEARCQQDGIGCQRMSSQLPFHSSYMRACNDEFSAYLDSVNFSTGSRTDVPCIVSTAPQETSIDAHSIRGLLKRHMVSGVEFVDAVNKAYAQGNTVFIEAGPKKVLTRLVENTLEGKPVTAVALDGLDGTSDLLAAVMQIGATGVNINWATFSALLVDTRSTGKAGNGEAKPDAEAHQYWINGARVWQSGKPAPLKTQHDLHAVISELAQRSSSATNNPASTQLDTYQHHPGGMHPHSDKPLSRVPHAMATTTNGNKSLMLVSQHPTVPSTAPVTMEHYNPVSSQRLEAFRTYHETLRLMITSQTQVFSAFLNSTGNTLLEHHTNEVLSLPREAEQLTQQFSHSVSESTPAIISPPAVPAPIIAPEVALPASTALGKGSGSDARASAPVSVPETATAQLNGHQGPVEALSAGSVLSQLTTLLSDRSGYPVELLDPDQDLESDLGIDSIKRIEVMGALMSALPAISSESMQQIQAGTRDLRTLREVSSHIAEVLSSSNATSATPEVAQPGK